MDRKAEERREERRGKKEGIRGGEGGEGEGDGGGGVGEVTGSESLEEGFNCPCWEGRGGEKKNLEYNKRILE